MFTSEFSKVQKENEMLREHNRNLKDELRSKDEIIKNWELEENQSQLKINEVSKSEEADASWPVQDDPTPVPALPKRRDKKSKKPVS